MQKNYVQIPWTTHTPSTKLAILAVRPGSRDYSKGWIPQPVVTRTESYSTNTVNPTGKCCVKQGRVASCSFFGERERERERERDRETETERQRQRQRQRQGQGERGGERKEDRGTNKINKKKQAERKR